MGFDNLVKAHALYESKYGNKFYNIALKVCQKGSVEEKTMAIASFLIYFNRVWYIYSDDGKKAFENLEKHVSDVYELIKVTEPMLGELKKQSLLNTDLKDIFIENSIKTLYKRFSEVFGATGASKALHLLNPRLFVMWDDNIRKNYKIDLPDESGYLRFLKMVKIEITDFVKDYAEREGLSFEEAEKSIKDRTGIEVTKLLDEQNYLKFTRKEMPQEIESKTDVTDKIDKILKIINEITEGAHEVANEDWVVRTGRSGMVRASADKLKRIVERYAEKRDIEGILNYLMNVQNDQTGKEVYKILKAYNKKTVEDVYDEIVRIARE